MPLDDAAQNLRALVDEAQTTLFGTAPSGGRAGQSISIRAGGRSLKAQCLTSISPGPVVAVLMPSGWGILPSNATRQVGQRQVDFRQSRSRVPSIAVTIFPLIAREYFNEASQTTNAIMILGSSSGFVKLFEEVDALGFGGQIAEYADDDYLVTWITRDPSPFTSNQRVGFYAPAVGLIRGVQVPDSADLLALTTKGYTAFRNLGNSSLDELWEIDIYDVSDPLQPSASFQDIPRFTIGPDGNNVLNIPQPMLANVWSIFSSVAPSLDRSEAVGVFPSVGIRIDSAFNSTGYIERDQPNGLFLIRYDPPDLWSIDVDFSSLAAGINTGTIYRELVDLTSQPPRIRAVSNTNLQFSLPSDWQQGSLDRVLDFYVPTEVPLP
ncbi:MAG: hypothetical protein AAF609_14935 [Cyanobacteria bacterium P01_C01_bin.120]